MNHEAVTHWRQLRNQAMLANSLAVEGSLLAEAGEYEAGLAATDEGYQLSAAINNWWGMAFNRINMAPVHLDRGNSARALAVCQAVMEHAGRAGFIIPLFVMPAYMADIYGELGAVPTALDQLTGARALQAPVAHMYQPLLRTIEIRVHLANGQVDEARSLAEAQADLLSGRTSYYSRGSMYYLLSVVPAVRSEIALLGGRPAEALAITEEAETLARQLAPRSITEILYWRARAQQAMSDAEAAGATLERARGLAEKIGQQRIQWRILALQAELAAQAGQSGQAEALLGRARAIISMIADHAGSPELRASFLARPALRAVVR